MFAANLIFFSFPLHGPILWYVYVLLIINRILQHRQVDPTNRNPEFSKFVRLENNQYSSLSVSEHIQPFNFWQIFCYRDAVINCQYTIPASHVFNNIHSPDCIHVFNFSYFFYRDLGGNQFEKIPSNSVHLRVDDLLSPFHFTFLSKYFKHLNMLYRYSLSHISRRIHLLMCSYYKCNLEVNLYVFHSSINDNRLRSIERYAFNGSQIATL